MEKQKKLTTPQMIEAVIAALARCEEAILHFSEVASDSGSTRSEKRHAQRMLTALNELRGCNLHGLRQSNGIQVEVAGGEVFEIIVRQLKQSPDEKKRSALER